MRVERRHEQLVAKDAKPVVHKTAAGCEPRRELSTVAPDLLAGARIQCPCHVLRTGYRQNVVANKRRRLEVAERRRLEGPLRLQFGDVIGCDLRQRAETMVGIIAPERQPAGAIGFETVDYFLNRDLRWRDRLLRD